MQQGHLSREGHFVLQAQVARHSPEQQAGGTRQQMQLFAQVGLLDTRGQRGERAEGEQEANRSQRADCFAHR